MEWTFFLALCAAAVYLPFSAYQANVAKYTKKEESKSK
jgi:uncharacterized membrane protein (DUF2068 family)